MSGAPHRTAQAYLWQARHRTLTAALYGLAFTALDFGCTGNFWMSYARGTASFVPLPDGQLVPDDDDGDDEEATLGLRSASSQLAKFVRPTLDRHEEEGLAAAHDESLEQQEQTALLSGGAPTGPESKHKRGSNTRRRLVHQVKSDGSARFCRKVRARLLLLSLPFERASEKLTRSLWTVQRPETGSSSPLLGLSALRPQDGSPLSLARRRLRRQSLSCSCLHSESNKKSPSGD